MSNAAAFENNVVPFSPKSKFNFISGFKRISERPKAEGHRETKELKVDEARDFGSGFLISQLNAYPAIMGGFNIKADLKKIIKIGDQSWDYDNFIITRDIGRLNFRETVELIAAFNRQRDAIHTKQAGEYPTRKEIILALENI